MTIAATVASRAAPESEGPNGRRQRDGDHAASDLPSLVTSFLEYMGQYRHASHHTLDAYRRDLQRLDSFLMSRRLPRSAGEIQKKHLQAFALSLSGLAPASINRMLNAISSFFGFLERQGMTTGNPVGGVERPRLSHRLPEVPSLEDLHQLVDAASDAREQAMILLLACCGLRRAELLDLAIGDLSADLTHLTVRHGKGDRDRTVPIPHQCRATIRRYLGDSPRQVGPLFINRAGNRIGNTGFYRIFNRLVRRAGLEGKRLSPHSLRHFYATSLLTSRTDVETVRSLLGHRDLRTTCRYLHATDEGQQAAVERLPVLCEMPGQDEGVSHDE